MHQGRKRVFSSWVFYVPFTHSILIIVAAIAGVLTPLSFTFYGTMIDEANSQDIDYDKLKILLLEIALLLLAASIFAFLERLCLGYFAGSSGYWIWSIENVTRHYRDHYVAAIFRRDVEFLEQFSPGRLGQRLSEESSRIVEGLGPGLGSLVRALASLFCGIVIGLVHVRIVSCLWS